jgi:hypothetical protein
MSQQNIELVKSLYAAFAARDTNAMFSKVSEKVEIAQSPELPWGGRYSGVEGFRRFFETLTKHLNNTGLEIERYLDAGDHVVAIGRTRGTVLSNGRPFDVPLAHVWEVRDGIILSFRPFIDNPTMARSLG